MTLTHDSASLYAQIFPVLLVILAIEGRGISYGKLKRSWKWALITARWSVASMCIAGMVITVGHVSFPASARIAGSEEIAFVLVQVFFYAAILGLGVMFGAMQLQETSEKLRVD